MAGVALFDFSLVAYPLYRTSQFIVCSDDQDQSDVAEAAEARRWLYFWLTFSMLEVMQSFGFDTVPGFHIVKGLGLISFYSAEHSTVLNALMPKLCAAYLGGVDKVTTWWRSTVPPVHEMSWFASLKNKWFVPVKQE